jgi:hypothetical protein
MGVLLFVNYETMVLTMMVINSININKTNNHLSSYLKPLNIKKNMTNDVGNRGASLGIG